MPDRDPTYDRRPPLYLCLFLILAGLFTAGAIILHVLTVTKEPDSGIEALAVTCVALAATIVGATLIYRKIETEAKRNREYAEQVMELTVQRVTDVIGRQARAEGYVEGVRDRLANGATITRIPSPRP